MLARRHAQGLSAAAVALALAAWPSGARADEYDAEDQEAAVLSVNGGAFSPLANSHFTKGAAKVGIGLSDPIPDSAVGIYVEGTGWLYKWDRYGFDKTQFDTTLVGGLSYRFKL